MKTAPNFTAWMDRQVMNNNIIMIKVFIKHKVLSVETILSTYMHACAHAHTHTHTHRHTHTGTRTHEHTDYTKFN